MRPATPEEIQNWDELIRNNPDGGNVLQIKAFAEVKTSQGWQPRYFMLNDTAILVLSRTCPWKLGEFWYIPKGPGVAGPDEFKDLARDAGKFGAFMVKIDPEIYKDYASPSSLAKMGLVKNPRDIQYNINTIVVDLVPTLDTILASCKQKTRYNIRLAEKKGVTVEAVSCSSENMDIMYGLMQETQKRAHFYLRNKQYFTDFWQRHAKQGRGQLFFARYEGKVLAGAFVTYMGESGLYKDGGSVREHSDVQPMYGLQWGIMKWLKEKGVREYDLHGVPPKDQMENSSHPLAGLARFKTGFNPEVTEYIGTYDLPLSRWKYWAWNRFAERLAASYELRVKHRLFY